MRSFYLLDMTRLQGIVQKSKYSKNNFKATYFLYRHSDSEISEYKIKLILVSRGIYSIQNHSSVLT